MHGIIHLTPQPASHIMQGIEHAVVSIFNIKPIFQRIHIHIPIDKAKTSRPILIEVLDDIADDPAFIACLSNKGSQALSGYRLTPTEKAAIISGDIGWIEAHAGRLTEHQKTWLKCRLEQENW